MKVAKTIGYVFGVTGLFIALLFLAYPILYFFSFLDSPESASIAAGFVHTIISGIILYIANNKLSKLLETKAAAISGCVTAYILFWLIYAYAPMGALPIFIYSIALIEPPTKQYRRIKNGLLAQSPCVCSYCGHLNDYDAVFCTECGSGLMHNQEPVKQDVKKTDPTPQKSSDQKIFNVWMVLLPLALCIFTAYLCFRFFSVALPDREILTDLVRLTNNLTGEELYTNVIIIPDESGEYYCVKGMVNPLTGLKDSVESNWESFGSESRLISSIGFRSSYSVTIDYRDLQVSFLEKLESHPIGFVLCFGSFVISVLLLFFMVRQENHRMKS
jgi:hypothetical protein